MDETVTKPDHLYIAWIFCIISVVTLIILLARKFFHYKTECWFCCERVKVPYLRRNSFICPHCDQYNGFNEDGDYNKAIPSMYSAELNPRRVHTEVVGQPQGQHNFLCESCHGNQILKIQQLAAFVPYNEITFETEMESFQHYLEDAYKLCPPCQLRVNQEIQRQDQILGRNLEAQQFRRNYKNSKMNRSNGWFLTCFVNLMQIATVCVMFSLLMSDVCILFNHKIIQLDPWIQHTEKHKLSLTVAGICLAILSSLFSWRERRKKMDALHLLLWLILLVFIPQPWKKLPDFIQRALVKDGYRCLVSLICSAMSLTWCYSNLQHSTKNRLITDITLDESVEGSEASSYASSEEEDVEVDGEMPPRAAAAQLQENQPKETPQQRGPVGESLNSLTLGPPRKTPKKTNDVWTSQIGRATPPLPETGTASTQESMSPRSVVHPARFNYTSNSPVGSAASSMVDGQTTSRQSRTYNNQAAYSQRQYKPHLDKDEASTSGIDASSDEACTSISRRTVSGKRKERSKKLEEKKSDFSHTLSLFWAVLFGISIGLNISAAIYFQSVRN